MKYAELVGATIALYRAKKHLTQKQLAKHAGITQTRLCRIEKGSTPLPVEVLANIAWQLNVLPSEILIVADEAQRMPERDVEKAFSVCAEQSRI